MIVLLLVFSLKLLFFFFFKQKTAYEMRISDWSSDVCSSDLTAGRLSPSPPSDWSANGLCIAPMTMTEGDRVAVRLGTGEVGVGAAWLTKLAHPPAAMIATARTDAMPADRPLLEVDDVGAAILALGRYARSRMTGKVIAITGSAGKTTAVAMAAHDLASFRAVGQSRTNPNQTGNTTCTEKVCSSV